MDVILYSKIAKVQKEVDGIVYVPVKYTDGDTDGFYNLKNGTTIEYRSASVSNPFRCMKMQVEEWMYRIKFNIVATVVSSSIFVAFSDSNDDYISKNKNAVGEQTLYIPSNAKYIYFSFFGDAYCSGYEIEEKPDARHLTGDDIAKLDGDTNGYYNLKNGNTIEYKTSNDFKCSKLLVEKWMKKIVFTIVSTMPAGSAIFVAFSDVEDNYISKNVNATGTQIINIPQNAKYIYLSFYGLTYCGSYYFVADIPFESANNPYNGKKAAAFGTSLTYRAMTRGGFLQYLPGFSGMTFDNQGVGSSKIYGSAEGSILNKVLNYGNFADKDICLIEGFVNDWYQSSPLGTYTDDTTASVCGCLRTAIQHIKTQKESIKIFVILDHYGTNDDGEDLSPSAVVNGLTQYVFYEECRKVCESMGIPVICLYKNSDISDLTPAYFADYIHPNAKGAERSARAIWDYMKTYDPR